ncbi:MAG: aminopeptidase, partial [Flavobacteriales bacterium]|nr:aminopeptidase [Flavobacteriales bacterium]
MKRATDHHSYSRPEEAVTTHLTWSAQVDFETRQVRATATYDIATSDDAQRLMLDCRDLTIHDVFVDGTKVDFDLGPARPFIGQPLSIPVTSSTQQVMVSYTTSPDAAAFLWVEGDSPFLFTQSQAILARSWV